MAHPPPPPPEMSPAEQRVRDFWQRMASNDFASLAPLLGGVIFDITGHYSALYGTLAVVYATAFTFLLLAADPQRHQPPVTEAAA